MIITKCWAAWLTLVASKVPFDSKDERPWMPFDRHSERKLEHGRIRDLLSFFEEVRAMNNHLLWERT